MHIAPHPAESEVKRLLAAAQLPTLDITPEHMKHFFGAWEGANLEGVVGLELLGSVALLRSLAVSDSRRGSGLGSALVAQAEQYALAQGVRSLFLLTTTAESYFTQRGYAPLPRAAAPEAIRRTREFAGICASSAVLMEKLL